MGCHWDTLGLDRNATSQQIKAAFRKLALLHHPDRHVNAPDKERLMEAARFRAVTEAYEVLSDERKQAAYRASQPSSSPYGSSNPSYGGSSYSYSRNAGYSYGYGSSEWSSQTSNPYARCRMTFWQAFSKSVGRTGSGARKLEAAVFSAMAGVALVGLFSVDRLWEYNNRGKGFDSINTSASKNSILKENIGSPPIGCKPARLHPYKGPDTDKNAARMSLADLIALEEEATLKTVRSGEGS